MRAATTCLFLRTLPILAMLISLACTPTSISTPLTRTAVPPLSPSAATSTSCTYQHAANGAVLPDPTCTPGATNPDVTQANLGATICKRGWTSTVRPPVSVTEPQKLASMKQYGATGPASAYEYDHRVPLETGGATDDTMNLWPEGYTRSGNAPPAGGSEAKDKIENFVNKQICSGAMTLADGQSVFEGDFWAWASSRNVNLSALLQNVIVL